jgi:multidrug efflux pump
MAKFFIERPIFAWVIALFIMVLGGVSITQLPIAQYPPVAPPAIVINATYPGASTWSRWRRPMAPAASR